MSDQADITIIGAGVVGLAIAAQVARNDRTVFVLEKNDSFGQETSSRHSGVIHSGIYYPPGSLKARLCVRGRQLLYEIAEKYSIGHKRPGKLIVAADDGEVNQLHTLMVRGEENRVDGLRLLSQREMRTLEPNITGAAAILSESTGIIDAYGLMKSFLGRAQANGAQVAYCTKMVGFEKTRDGYSVNIEDTGGKSTFATRLLLNCAGLWSDKVAAMAGIDIDMAGYRLHYCKGEYFSVGNGKNRFVKRLIYPVPLAEIAGVGIHVTFDLDGRMRLGPNVHYLDRLDYTVDISHKVPFYESAKKMLPFIELDDLEPEMAGIRPKLQEEGGPFRDFVIREESDKGLPGLINLIGIESPGLTSSPAIAEYVGKIVDAYLR